MYKLTALSQQYQELRKGATCYYATILNMYSKSVEHIALSETLWSYFIHYAKHKRLSAQIA